MNKRIFASGAIGIPKDDAKNWSSIPNLQSLKIFEQGWPGDDTICGWGSKIEHTVNVRHSLPRIVQQYNIKTVNDAGCGDLHWIKDLDFLTVDYLGYDIYERNTWPELRANGWKLEVADVTKDTLRSVDLTIVRDVFIHLPNRLILDALDKLKLTTKYLLATNFIRDGAEEREVDNFGRINEPNLKHSKLNLVEPPFDLGPPLLIIPEDYPFKNLSLWRLK